MSLVTPAFADKTTTIVRGTKMRLFLLLHVAGDHSRDLGRMRAQRPDVSRRG